MIKQLFVILGVCCVCCASVAQIGSYRADQFAGKWLWFDYKVDGVSDVDAMADIDSTTYWLHANGNATFSMRKIPADSDSVYVDGVWKYKSRSNELTIDWNKGLAAKVQAEVLLLNENTLVIREVFLDGRTRVVKEYHFRKVP